MARTKGGMLTKPEVRKAVCRHPIEWDKNQFSKLKEKALGKPVKERLVNEASAIDLWNGGLDRIFSNSPYFYHPIYFINHLEKAGLLEFNPYEGKKYKDVYGYDGNAPGIDMDAVITGNPGFAPIYVKTTHAKSPNINGYACVTGFFNEEYTNKSGGKYYHEGVDFRGNNTAIKSFIYGKVVACRNQGNKHYGVSILVQGDRKEDGKNMFYLLGHMTSHIVNKGDSVYPGKIVGYVGNTGISSASHLHLSVYKTEVTKGEKLFTDTYITKYKVGNEWKSDIVNPFDHKIERRF